MFEGQKVKKLEEEVAKLTAKVNCLTGEHEWENLHEIRTKDSVVVKRGYHKPESDLIYSIKPYVACKHCEFTLEAKELHNGRGDYHD